MGASDTCIIIDSACDLPAGFIKQNDIAILPTTVRVGSKRFLDRRNEDETASLYREGFNGHRFDTEITAYSVEQISDAIVRRVATRYEKALVLTISSHNSALYENVCTALHEHQDRFREARRAAGRGENFSIRALDTEAVFAGQGIVAREAVRLARKGNLPLSKLSTRLEDLCQQVYTYIIPCDPQQLDNLDIEQENKLVGWINNMLGNMFNFKPVIQVHCGEAKMIMRGSGFDRALKLLLEHAMRQIKQGLAPKLIAISYAGELPVLKNKTLFKQFIRFAEHYDVEVMISVMSATAAVNIGPGSFSLAFAAA
ncbi:MAG: DegV family protein [Acidiferrobacterales bacterium]